MIDPILYCEFRTSLSCDGVSVRFMLWVRYKTRGYVGSVLDWRFLHVSSLSTLALHRSRLVNNSCSSWWYVLERGEHYAQAGTTTPVNLVSFRTSRPTEVSAAAVGKAS